MADGTYDSADAVVIDRPGVRIIDVMDEEGAGADERLLALLNVLEFTIAAVECPGCRKQMVKALRQAIAAMLRNIPTLAAELRAEDDEAPTHVH
jgi:hypothetical protein